MNNYTKEEVQSLFQQLDMFIEMDDAEFNTAKENQIDSMRKIIYLIDGHYAVDCEIDLDYMNAIRVKKRVLSRVFGNVILLSSQMASTGNIESALDKLDDFIDDCSSPFFIKQAKDRKVFLESHK